MFSAVFVFEWLEWSRLGSRRRRSLVLALALDRSLASSITASAPYPLRPPLSHSCVPYYDSPLYPSCPADDWLKFQLRSILPILCPCGSPSPLPRTPANLPRTQGRGDLGQGRPQEEVNVDMIPYISCRFSASGLALAQGVHAHCITYRVATATCRAVMRECGSGRYEPSSSPCERMMEVTSSWWQELSTRCGLVDQRMFARPW
jgi:hypothetical protein